jgi:DNA-binding transcriptional LysR family regulator
VHLRQLEYFVAVCESESFTKAAERLFITQPSLSQQVKRLEADLKVTLLDRTARSARPTPAGRALLPVAREVLASAARAEQVVRDVRAGERGDLEVLTVRSIATAILPPGVGLWHKRFPGVVLRISDHPHAEAMEAAFRDGAGDLAIGPRIDLSVTHTVSLGYEELVLIAGPLSGLHTDKPLALEDLKTQQWVLFDSANGLTRIIRTLCASAGFQPLATVFTGQVETALELASSGMAVTLIPNNAVRGNSRQHAKSLTPPVFREICAYSRPGTRSLSDAFIDTMLSAEPVLLSRAELPSAFSLA